MKKVIVTGASGFIGKKMSMYMLKKGYNVIGWDIKGLNWSCGVKKINLLDRSEVEEELTKVRPDIMFHCAGSADVGKSIQDPVLDYESNVTLTHNLLFAMHRCGLEKQPFVFLSSAGVYGDPKSLPIKEDMSVDPLSPYAVHKVMCEELCKYFVANYGMDIKIARIFSAYGAGLKKQIFWDMYNKMIQTKRLEMFGTGNESRDYIYIDDVVSALYLLATEKSDLIFFNIANGEEITIRKVVEIFAKYEKIDKEKIIFNGMIREGDPINWRADITRIKKLGYRKTMDIDEGIREYCDWARLLK